MKYKCVCCGTSSDNEEDFIFIDFIGGGGWYCHDCHFKDEAL